MCVLYENFLALSTFFGYFTRLRSGATLAKQVQGTHSMSLSAEIKVVMGQSVVGSVYDHAVTMIQDRIVVDTISAVCFQCTV